MKIDRLIGITMYLLNRDKASAKELADRFEVSVRTIVRDMDALSGAGIPIASYPGSGGGYAILDTYRLDRRFATAADYQNILTALQALLTAYDSRELSDTAEKLPVQSGPTQHVFFDFSIKHLIISGGVWRLTVFKFHKLVAVVITVAVDLINFHTHFIHLPSLCPSFLRVRNIPSICLAPTRELSLL